MMFIKFEGKKFLVISYNYCPSTNSVFGIIFDDTKPAPFLTNFSMSSSEFQERMSFKGGK